MLQALAQYLVNLNVWTHNVLTILARRKALQSSSRCNVQHAGALAIAVSLASLLSNLLSSFLLFAGPVPALVLSHSPRDGKSPFLAFGSSRFAHHKDTAQHADIEAHLQCTPPLGHGAGFISSQACGLPLHP